MQQPDTANFGDRLQTSIAQVFGQTLPALIGALVIVFAGYLLAKVLEKLTERGLRRILIEGGAHTVSRFIAAGCLDRLHVMVAPIMFGSGQTGVTLAPIARADQALRSPMRAHLIGDEVLLDCDLSAQRVVIGCAKKST